jgi:hypothetical protein
MNIKDVLKQRPPVGPGVDATCVECGATFQLKAGAKVEKPRCVPCLLGKLGPGVVGLTIKKEKK